MLESPNKVSHLNNYKGDIITEKAYYYNNRTMLFQQVCTLNNSSAVTVENCN